MPFVQNHAGQWNMDVVEDRITVKIANWLSVRQYLCVDLRLVYLKVDRMMV